MTRFKNKSFIQSMGYALEGVRLAWSESNFRRHCLFACIAMITGVFLQLTREEWALVVIAIGIVMVTEILNTSLEYLCDYIQPNYHHMIAYVKNLSAAAVLVASISALSVGMVILIPKIMALWFHL